MTLSTQSSTAGYDTYVQDRTGLCDGIEEILRDATDQEGRELRAALLEDLTTIAERSVWYVTPHEALGNQTPAEVIASARYRHALLALRPWLLNPTSKMS